MQNIDIKNHVLGKSIYVDDIPIIQGTLFGVIYGSDIAHGTIKNIDISDALKINGVKHIIDYKDIPGENQIGGIIPDEPLFAENEVHFQGQPILLILAESEEVAFRARRQIKIEYLNKAVVTDPRVAYANGDFTSTPRIFKCGDIESIWSKCSYVYEGEVESGGQEHLYIETQGSYAIPEENDKLKIISSTQGPTAGQKIAARVLNIPMHQIEFDVRRLGGGFGGKEDQATPWAVMAGLGAIVSGKPVKVVLDRMDDLKMTGKRHPYSSDYKIGLDNNYRIIAYQVDFYQNAGAAADLSPAILERTLFHTTNAYCIPNVLAKAYSCKTNLPPNTAFRGFGGPQAMFVIESAIVNAAERIGISPQIIQEKNLLSDNDVFPFGQVASQTLAKKSWNQLVDKYDFDKFKLDIKSFNKKHKYKKQGYAMMPICFGISFTNTPMNQARALVHVYQDGSIGVSTGAVEMGQGVNTKMMQIASSVFGVSIDKIKIETTNTTRVANTSPTAASATADLNGKALQIACTKIKDRMIGYLKSKFNQEEYTFNDNMVSRDDFSIKWEDIVQEVFLERISLSSIGHYATPQIHYDKSIEKGHPFAYHVYGTALTKVTVDAIRGTYNIDEVKIVHDFGQSMNKTIDIGQIEGGLVQGIGWMTLEELKYNEEGRLLSNSLSTYKVPDYHSAPDTIDIDFLDTEGHDLAILKSKAVGEPPLMYGIGSYFAIRNAIRAIHKTKELEFDAPYTVEKVLMDIIE